MSLNPLKIVYAKLDDGLWHVTLATYFNQADVRCKPHRKVPSTWLSTAPMVHDPTARFCQVCLTLEGNHL